MDGLCAAVTEINYAYSPVRALDCLELMSLKPGKWLIIT